MAEEFKPIDLPVSHEAGTAFAPNATAAGFSSVQTPGGAISFYKPLEAPVASPAAPPAQSSDSAEQEKAQLASDIQGAQNKILPTEEIPGVNAMKNLGTQQADLLKSRQDQLTARRTAETERINNEFAALKTQQEGQQKQETGATSTKLARMGGYLGEGSAGMQYEVSLEAQHRSEVRDLESKRQAALLAAQTAFEDNDFRLAQQQLDSAKETEQTIYDRQQNYAEEKRKINDQQMKEAQFELDYEKTISDITGTFRGDPTYQAVQDDLKNALQIGNLMGEFMGAETLEAKKLVIQQALDEANLDLKTNEFLWSQQQDQIANDFKKAGIELDYANLDLETMKDNASSLGIKPPTSIELSAFGYYNRANDAEKKIADLEPVIANLGLLGQANLRYAPNVLQNPDYQMFNQAKRQFVEAYLRKDSGAAIAQSEYENADKTYFPQPGDSSEVLEAKKSARASILESLRSQSGNALKAYEQNAGAGTSNPIDAFIKDHPDKLEVIEQMVNEGISEQDIINALQ